MFFSTLPLRAFVHAIWNTTLEKRPWKGSVYEWHIAKKVISAIKIITATSLHYTLTYSRLLFTWLPPHFPILFYSVLPLWPKQSILQISYPSIILRSVQTKISIMSNESNDSFPLLHSSTLLPMKTQTISCITNNNQNNVWKSQQIQRVYCICCHIFWLSETILSMHNEDINVSLNIV